MRMEDRQLMLWSLEHVVHIIMRDIFFYPTVAFAVTSNNGSIKQNSLCKFLSQQLEWLMTCCDVLYSVQRDVVVNHNTIVGPLLHAKLC